MFFFFNTKAGSVFEERFEECFRLVCVLEECFRLVWTEDITVVVKRRFEICPGPAM